MPQKYYDIRLRGRRRCSNCFWWENRVCYFNNYPEDYPEILEDSWCPDWYSRRIANKDGEFLHNSPLYIKACNKTEFYVLYVDI